MGEEDAEEKFIVMNWEKKMTPRKVKEKQCSTLSIGKSQVEQPYDRIDKEECFLEKRRKFLIFPKNIL